MNKKGFRQILSILLSFSLLSIGQPAHAVKVSDSFYFYRPTQVAGYRAQTVFNNSNPKLIDNLWVAHLFPSAELSGRNVTELIKKHSSKSPAELLQLAKNKNFEAEYQCQIEAEGDPRAQEALDDMYDDALAAKGYVDTGINNCNGGKEESEELSIVVMAQDQLNLIMKHGPTLRDLLNADKFDESWNFAKQNHLVRVIIQSVGFSILGTKAFDSSRMKSFYASAHRNWDIVISEGFPYKPKRWGDSRNHSSAASANSAHADMKELPNVAYFISKDPKTKLGDILKNLFVGVVLSIVTAGIGSAISGAISSSVGSTVTATTSVTAGGVTTATTTTSTLIAGVNVSAGTIGGTVLSVGSNALAGAIVGTAQGQNFGDALVSGVLGGATGAVVGSAANSLGVGDAINGVIQNDTVASYVTGVTLGTATGAILNGGDIDAAFTGAASGTATSMIAGALTNPGPTQEEMREYLDALAAGTQTQIQNANGQILNNQLSNLANNLANQQAIAAQNTISNHANTAMGGLDFSNTIQNQNLFDRLGAAQTAGAQMDRYLDNIRANQADFDAAADGYESVTVTNIAAEMDARNLVPGSAGIAFNPTIIPLDHPLYSALLEAGLINLRTGEVIDLRAAARFGYHGTRGASYDAVLTLVSRGGGGTFSEEIFNLAMNNPEEFVRQYDQSLLDRILFESDKIAIWQDLEVARRSPYAGYSSRLGTWTGEGTIMVVDTNGDRVYTANDRPDTPWLNDHPNTPLDEQSYRNLDERFVTGDHRVVGEIDPVTGEVKWADPAYSGSSTLRRGVMSVVRGGTVVLVAVDAGAILRDIGDAAHDALPGARSDLADAVDDFMNDDNLTSMDIENLEAAGNAVVGLQVLDALGNNPVAEGLGDVSDTINDAIGEHVIDPLVENIANHVEDGNIILLPGGYGVFRPPTSTTARKPASTSKTNSTTTVTQNKPATTTSNSVSGYIGPAVQYVPPKVSVIPTGVVTRSPARFGGSSSTRGSFRHNLFK